MSFNLKSQSGWFYLFTGVHSFIIGLFLFFAPVWLWQQGFNLTDISLTISLMAASFMGTLWLWDRARQKCPPRVFNWGALLLGTLMVALVFAVEQIWFLPVFALVLGGYNCFMWTTQRALFLDLIDPNTSGQAYGNLQVFVFLVLQVAIFSGAYLNDHSYYGWLLLLAGTLSLMGGCTLHGFGRALDWPKTLQKLPPLSFRDVVNFKDSARSRSIFLLDGPFLFFESWFWLLSLFWLSGESILNLGWLVIGLALVFSVLFWLLKNFVDRWENAGINIYRWATLLYLMSWGMRAFIPQLENWTIIGLLLVMIMFFTTYFRLLFNKKFYDQAHQDRGHHYLILKSYYSQFGLVIVFMMLGLASLSVTDISWLYGLLILFGLGYLWYAPKIINS